MPLRLGPEREGVSPTAAQSVTPWQRHPSLSNCLSSLAEDIDSCLCLGWSVGCPLFPSGFVLWKLPPNSGLGSFPLLCSQAGNTSFLVPALSGATAFAETGQASRPLMPLWIPFSQHVRVTETSPGLACLDTVCPGLPLGRALATQATRGWPLVGIWA